MAEIENFKEPCEGLLETQIGNADISDQFYNWMSIKGVSLSYNSNETNIANNISGILLRQ